MHINNEYKAYLFQILSGGRDSGMHERLRIVCYIKVSRNLQEFVDAVHQSTSENAISQHSSFVLKKVCGIVQIQEHPSAILYLLPPKVLQKAQIYAKSSPEKAYRIRAIPPAHKFHVTVLLTLPESEYNQRLGMFQVRFCLACSPHSYAQIYCSHS